jgi:hypothetical protein
VDTAEQQREEDEFAEDLAGPDVEALKGLTKLAEQAMKAAKVVEDKEAELKSAKNTLHHLTMKVIPDALAAAGVSTFTTLKAPFLKITTKEYIHGTLPKEAEARERALAWLENNDAADIIKNQIAVDLGKGEDNMAKAVKSALDEMEIDYSVKKDVHPQTLAAFARERLRNGEEVDLETLGLFAGRVAKVEVKS